MHPAKQVSVPFMVVGILFCVALITSNLLEMKVFHFAGPFSLTCGFLVFPISYILNDCMAEVWGYAKARFVIWMGFLMDFLVMAFAGIACLIPPAEPGGDAAFREMFTFAPQIVVASLLAFLVGSFLNASVMSRMKLADRGKPHFNLRFAWRAVLSTIVGESADSLIFFPLAFVVFPIAVSGQPAVSVPTMLSLMGTQVVAKTLYETILLPLTTRVVKWLKRVEGTDAFDENISYNPFKFEV